MSRMQISRQGGVEGTRRTGAEQVRTQTNGPDAPQKPQPVHIEKKIGRNDPCPCGSGKKYKNCHGRADAQA